MKNNKEAALATITFLTRTAELKSHFDVIHALTMERQKMLKVIITKEKEMADHARTIDESYTTLKKHKAQLAEEVVYIMGIFENLNKYALKNEPSSDLINKFTDI